MTAAVILNYNDPLATIAAVRRITGYGSIDRIIVVDNASTDDSVRIMKAEFEGNREYLGVDLIRSRKNGGYGYGNNRGISYAGKKYGIQYALIANPDSCFGEDIVTGMQEIFRVHADAAAVGAVMSRDTAVSDEGILSGTAGITLSEYRLSGWKKRGFAGELLASAPIFKRIFSFAIDYSLGYYEKAEHHIKAGGADFHANVSAAKVYAVHGSLVMVDVEKFLSCGGFDEDMFLYMEEHALAARLEAHGYGTYLLRKKYIHEGSHSISGSGLGAVSRQRLRAASEIIYYRKYLHAGKPGLLAAGLLQHIVILETCLISLTASLMSGLRH